MRGGRKALGHHARVEPPQVTPNLREHAVMAEGTQFRRGIRHGPVFHDHPIGRHRDPRAVRPVQAVDEYGLLRGVAHQAQEHGDLAVARQPGAPE